MGPDASSLQVTSRSNWCYYAQETKVDDEPRDYYGPLCWQVFEADLDDFEKLMWYDVMMEFECRATSTWSSCEEREEMACTHRHWGPKGKLSQLYHTLGPKTNMCDTYMCNKEQMCSTWDHYPENAVAQKDEEGGWCIVKRKNEHGDDHQTANKRRSSRRWCF